MAIEMVRDIAGRTWPLWKQEQFNSCAAASAFMAVCMVKRQSLIGGEEHFRKLIFRQGVHPFQLGMPDGRGTPLAVISSILRNEGVHVSANLNGSLVDLRGKCLGAGEHSPVIVAVRWTEGGHAVVCVGNAKDNFVFLDPWYGLIEIPVSLWPNYHVKPRSNVDGSSEGKLTGAYWHCIGLVK